MQGQIAGTHLNSLLLALGLDLLAVVACTLSIVAALRAARPRRDGGARPSSSPSPSA
jgi:hypothetical protein